MPNFVMDGTGTVCILSGRTYTKVNPGRAIVGVAVNSGGYIGPLLVSELADAVTYSATSGGPWAYESTIQHKGITYYVNAGAHFMDGTPTDTSGLDRYRCSAIGLDAAAEELLNAYERSTIPTAGQIADYTGLAYNRTDKLYYFDGTALSQIGKVYGYDGTALHPIYSAEEYVLKNGHSADFALTTYRTDASANTTFGEEQWAGSLVLTATNDNAYWKLATNRKVTSQKVNVSGYSKIRVDVNCFHAWGNGGIQFGLANAIDYTNVVKYELANTTGRRTLELDISDYNGDYYVFFGAFVWSEEYQSGSVQSVWYEVKLE